jgi:hypothetical protein
MKKRESNCQTKKIKIWSWTPMGADTKMNWLIDRQSQNQLELAARIFSSYPWEL